ncbi:hypothetical protein ACHAWF_011086, partial [Thalassiosira exigua]
LPILHDAASEEASGTDRSPSPASSPQTRIVRIPHDESNPLVEEVVVPVASASGEGGGGGGGGGDAVPSHLLRSLGLDDADADGVRVVPLIRTTHPPPGASQGECASLAGLFAYSVGPGGGPAPSSPDEDVPSPPPPPPPPPNVRATRLAMACGLRSARFFGDVWAGRVGHHRRLPGCGGLSLGNVDLFTSDVAFACRGSPDLRTAIADEMRGVRVPEWLGEAPRKTYEDGALLAALAAAMTRAEAREVEEDEEGDRDDGSSPSSSEGDGSWASSPGKEDDEANAAPAQKIANATLCLHCRRPAAELCDGCGGAYFCEEPRKCKANGWSHRCLCPTWRLYVRRRDRLSDFPHFSGWQLPLLGMDCFASEAPYRRFLTDVLGVLPSSTSRAAGTKAGDNWWSTELHGWSGGDGRTSRAVDVLRRRSYREGFALGDPTWIPEERRVVAEDVARANARCAEDRPDADADAADLIRTDDNGLCVLTSWEHYYRLRSLPPSSPAGLLLTFPLTLYHAIRRYGAVPLAAARMLERPLRVHVVGVEKELNFADLFKEVGFLLPEDVRVDLTWIVREDMFPKDGGGAAGKDVSLRLTTNLGLNVVGGTYGEGLDPDFDVAGGAPDMIVGMNAGLFAYESWRHVVTYLRRRPNVVGVFTDYNEHSGTNCASLGGGESANSLVMNPFRQMRAMPVYCMNLPQLSNGFFYVFNEQELDE